MKSISFFHEPIDHLAQGSKSVQMTFSDSSQMKMLDQQRIAKLKPLAEEIAAKLPNQ